MDVIKIFIRDTMKLTVGDVEKITNQNQLLEIVRNPDVDVRIRIKAAENIKDKSIFKDFAHDNDSFLRYYAAKYIDDDETLLDLILNDSNDFVRHNAGSNFIDYCDSERYEDVLLEFALENPRYNVSPLTETDTLARFACHNIRDTSKLLKVIKESKSPYVYNYAMRKVDKKALHDLLYSGKLDRARALEVAMKLEDDEKLGELLDVAIGPKSRFIPNAGEDPDNIAGHTVSNIFPGDDIYSSIVFSCQNEEITIRALKLIGYPSNLKRIIEYHENPKIRQLAKNQLEKGTL
jgi:hypothetical protein